MTDTPAERGAEGTWARLRRRKVVQWGFAYAAAAWVLLQVLEYFSGTFDWPRQIQQLTTVALLIGLPVALILACYHGAAAEAYARRILKAANSAGDTLAHAVLLVAATPASSRSVLVASCPRLAGTPISVECTCYRAAIDLAWLMKDSRDTESANELLELSESFGRFRAILGMDLGFRTCASTPCAATPL